MKSTSACVSMLVLTAAASSSAQSGLVCNGPGCPQAAASIPVDSGSGSALVCAPPQCRQGELPFDFTVVRARPAVTSTDDDSGSGSVLICTPPPCRQAEFPFDSRVASERGMARVLVGSAVVCSGPLCGQADVSFDSRVGGAQGTAMTLVDSDPKRAVVCSIQPCRHALVSCVPDSALPFAVHRSTG